MPELLVPTEGLGVRIPGVPPVRRVAVIEVPFKQEDGR
jgi:hypothetical protein